MTDAVLLEALAERLARLGLVVVRHGNHIAVRGSLLTSVRVRVVGGVLHCDPYLAYLPRTRATLARNFGLSILAGAAILGRRGGVEAPIMAFIALSSWGFDGLCYVLTESGMTQVRQSFAALTEGAGVESPREPRHLGVPPMVTAPVARDRAVPEVRQE